MPATPLLRPVHALRIGVVLLAALAAGCATRGSAPVEERKPAPVAQPKPPAPEPVTAAVPAPAVAPAPAGSYRVKRGDTLYGIALDHGQDPRDLVRWNKLDNPNRIQVGQLLRVAPPEGEGGVQVGAARGAGPVESRSIDGGPAPASSPAAQTPVQAGAAPGATPGAASGAPGTTRTEPKALRLPYSSENLALLQKSESQGQASAQAAPAAKPAPKPAAEAKPAPEKPAAEAKPEPARPAPAASAPASSAADPDAPEFIWPARGKVIGSFNDSTNKGVDIAGKPGDPVVAAAPGRVIYIGTGIRGYGKLIVIKHDANFNSVYAHNREILVKQDQTVARGQKIAELGDTDADTPKLHFEIRRSGKPVDPVKFLPAQ